MDDTAAADRHTGHCLCGGVAFTVTGRLRDVFDCHCERCRRFTGHHMAATAADPADVAIDGEELVRWYAPHSTVEYGFCGRCGSSLFWRAHAHPDKLCIAAGTLDQPTGLRTTTAWWVAEAGDYFDRPAGLVEHRHDG